MKNTLLLVALFATLVPNLFAQTENTAAVAWERYRHSDLDVSLNLPKMPIVIEQSDLCTEEFKRTSWVYADGAVYAFTIVARIPAKVRPTNCPPNKWIFDQSTIDRRLEEWRHLKGAVETKVRTSDLDAYQFKLDSSIRLLVPDIVHQRMFEMVVTHYPKEAPDVRTFFDSLVFDASSGKEIGNGAAVTLGDPIADGAGTPPEIATAKVAAVSNKNAASIPGAGSGRSDAVKEVVSPDGNPVATPLAIFAKPQARYTDAARNGDEAGSVRLKATLLSNGAVGTVTALSELRFGLTEQAIKAARRIVFLPARVNGVPISKTITIDYAFSIY